MILKCRVICLLTALYGLRVMVAVNGGANFRVNRAVGQQMRSIDPKAIIHVPKQIHPATFQLMQEQRNVLFFKIAQTAQNNRFLYLGSFLRSPNLEPFLTVPFRFRHGQPVVIWKQKGPGRSLDFYRFLVIDSKQFDQIFHTIGSKSVTLDKIDSLRA